MTKREQTYLCIINTLSRQLHFTIADCNAHIVAIEQRANEEIDRLRAEQVKQDQAKINSILESADDIWQELQQAEANVARLQSKLKFKKRAMREE